MMRKSPARDRTFRLLSQHGGSIDVSSTTQVIKQFIGHVREHVSCSCVSDDLGKSHPVEIEQPRRSHHRFVDHAGPRTIF